ncbi:MAG: putative toxin-antitoxin system toxin component, PIN family [Casimicrobium sp.]
MATSKKTSATRVVLDTNIVLSALVFRGGVAARARSAWQAGVFTPLVSTATAQELVRVLAYPKFKLTAEDCEELLADYLPYTTTVRIPDPPPRVPECRDAFDMMFLHLAVAGKAKVLVTGDQDLLALAGQTKFKILTLDAFLSTIEIAD